MRVGEFFTLPFTAFTDSHFTAGCAGNPEGRRGRKGYHTQWCAPQRWQVMADLKRKAPPGAASAAASGKRELGWADGAARDGTKRARRVDESDREDLDAQARDVDVWLVKVPSYLMDEWDRRRRCAANHGMWMSCTHTRARLALEPS
jgi:hypothetical protein